jgi:hypothetical protein
MAFGKEINITKDAQTNSATTITTNSCSVEFELSGDNTTWLSNVGITSSNRLSFTAAKNDYAHRTAIIKPKVNNNVCTNESKWVKVTQSGGCLCESTISIPTSATTTGITWSWNSTASSSVTATIDSLPCIDGTAPTYGISATSVNGNFNASVTSNTNNSVSILVSPKNNNTAHTVITDEVEVSYNVKDIGACTYPSTIKVMQGRKPCDCEDVIITSSSELDLTTTAQTVTSGFTFSLDGNCTEAASITVTSGSSWLTATAHKASSNNNDYYVTVTVPQNSSYERSGIIKPIVNGATCDNIEFIVTQANACNCNQLILTPSNINLDSGGTSQTITISNISSCITSSAVTTSQSWLKAQLNGNTIIVSGDTNHDPRRNTSGRVDYVCDGTNYSKSFTVTQSGGCVCENMFSVPATATTNGLSWDANKSGSSVTQTVTVPINNPNCLLGKQVTSSGEHFNITVQQMSDNSNIRIRVYPKDINTSTTTPIEEELTITYSLQEGENCVCPDTIKLTHDTKPCDCDDFEIIS